MPNVIWALWLFSFCNGNWLKQYIYINIQYTQFAWMTKKCQVNKFTYSMSEQAFCFYQVGLSKRSQCVWLFCFSSLVSVSTPVISVVGMAVVGEPFKILCQSATGSFPINYTLLKNGNPVKTFIVNLPKEKAMFQVTITRSDEISNYMCQAKNGHKEAQHSKRLNTTVIGEYSNQFYKTECFYICFNNTKSMNELQYCQYRQYSQN